MYYIFRWRSDGWHRDWWDADNPSGYASKAEALAKVEELKAYYRKRTGKEMWPPPQIVAAQPGHAAPPLWKPKRKTMLQRDRVDALPNGCTHLPEALPARKIKVSR
jgi:hypothetical protein